MVNLKKNSPIKPVTSALARNIWNVHSNTRYHIAETANLDGLDFLNIPRSLIEQRSWHLLNDISAGGQHGWRKATPFLRRTWTKRHVLYETALGSVNRRESASQPCWRCNRMPGYVHNFNEWFEIKEAHGVRLQRFQHVSVTDQNERCVSPAWKANIYSNTVFDP